MITSLYNLAKLELVSWQTKVQASALQTFANVFVDRSSNCCLIFFTWIGVRNTQRVTFARRYFCTDLYFCTSSLIYEGSLLHRITLTRIDTFGRV